MTRRSKGVIVLALFAIACSGNDDGGDEPVEGSLAEALTSGVEFEDGVLRSGRLPSANEGGERLRLSDEPDTLMLAAGSGSLMALDVENPDEDSEPMESTLIQFKGAGSHIEVPRGDNVSSPNDGELHVELPFEVDDDICEQLCNKRHSSIVIVAIRLEDGSVSVHEERALTLDCTEDGDPDLCGLEVPGGTPGRDAAMDDGGGGGGEDGGAVVMRDAATSGTGGTGGAGGAGGTGGASADAGVDAGDAASGSPPMLGLITPADAAAATEVELSITGTGFTPATVVYVDGQAMPTTYVGEDEITATVSAAATADAGSLLVYVENSPGDATTRSNVLYLLVSPTPGAPVIYDYTPDNGVAGDTVLIIASNLAGQALTIEDASGATITPGILGMISWPNAGVVDTVEIVLPDDIASGPITVSNTLGSFRGKIFSVGDNLTRAAGTVVESSSEYNTTNWGRASGADNRLDTSFFTALGDCATAASCTMRVPWYQITFPDPQAVARIAIRGNREYASGYDFLRARFEVLDAAGDALWQGDYDLPAPDRDLDITFPIPIEDALSVRFTSLADESAEPGFSELEVFGP